MCFSATANFVGSGVLGALGVFTLTKVKHRRELLFASLPTLFAVHQFIEGFVWLGLDGNLSPTVTLDMGAAFMLYAQGILPFLVPLSVMLFEPDLKSRRRMLPFVVLGVLVAVAPAGVVDPIASLEHSSAVPHFHTGIVNYVGGAPNKINLYVGKQAVKFNIPEGEAVDRLVDLIKENGKWFDAPVPVAAA